MDDHRDRPFPGQFAHPWSYARCYFVSDAIKARRPNPDRYACSRSGGVVLCDGCRTQRLPIA